jgi:hypothetical protein
LSFWNALQAPALTVDVFPLREQNVESSAGDLSVTSADVMVQQLKKLREKNPGMCYRGDN